MDAAAFARLLDPLAALLGEGSEDAPAGQTLPDAVEEALVQLALAGSEDTFCKPLNHKVRLHACTGMPLRGCSPHAACSLQRFVAWLLQMSLPLTGTTPDIAGGSIWGQCLHMLDRLHQHCVSMHAHCSRWQ